MKYRPTEEATKLLCELLARCVEITNNTKADCFFSYSAHINLYSVDIHRNGWTRGVEGEMVADILTVTEENVKDSLDKLAEIYRELEVAKNV